MKSISYSQEEILRNIINLYNGGRTFEVDPCYSKGIFYKNIERPKYCFDIEPQLQIWYFAILDNCMGSGTTGVACINTNRNFIGIEKKVF